jgi:hypothetical protein
MINKLFFILLFILLIFLFFYILKKKYTKINNIEKFKNNCNNFYKGKTFCQLNKNNNKCECKYQKDGINYPFKAPEPCCNNKCSKIKPEECHEQNNKLENYYYCNIAGKCIKYKGTIKNNKISENNCGLDPLNNQLLLPYITKEDCESKNNPCKKYNDLKMSTTEKKSKCLKDTNCGFCTNNYGDGKCIEGTATGPNDIIKYYYCVPGQSKTNKYTYGDHALYII